MNKVAVTVIFLIVFCWAFWFVGTLGFFNTGPEGAVITYDDKYTLNNLLADGFLIAGLGALAILMRVAGVKINAFALVMFIEIFWYPYLKTVFIFTSVLAIAPAVLISIVGIWTTVMLFMFAYTLIEWSNSSVITS